MFSDKAVEIIKYFEGFRAKPYYCSAGVPTIGYGTTTYPTGEKVKITDKAINGLIASEILKWHIIEKVHKPLMKLIDRDKLNQNQYDSLVSFCYNVGIGAFKGSTLRKVILEDPNNFDAIEVQFMRWNKAGGKVIDGLISRRKKEFLLYSS